jgi:hypothetical protein
MCVCMYIHEHTHTRTHTDTHTQTHTHQHLTLGERVRQDGKAVVRDVDSGDLFRGKSAVVSALFLVLKAVENE